MTTPIELEEAVVRLGRELPEALQSSGVPGAAVGLLLRGEERYVCAGVTSVEHPLPVDEATLFQIGSTTKTLTATLVMHLVERGLLDIDAPVHQYVPELRLADQSAWNTLSLQHVLTHMGGHDGDLFEDFGRGEEALARACAAMDVLPQLAGVGEVWSYSNAGFMLAGRAVETVTGMPFEQACRELVLEPLGLHRSTFFAEDAITHRVAVGHHDGPDGPVVARPWALSRAINPAGGLAASIEDQIRYARFHLIDEAPTSSSPLLGADTLRSMQAPLVQAGGGRAAACGLAWLLQATPGVIAHGGETNGQSSAFVIVPSLHAAVAVATNSSRGAAVHGHIVRWVLRELFGVAPSRPTTEPGPSDLLGAVQGTFVSRLEEIVVDTKGDELRVALRPTPLGLSAFPGAAGSDLAPAELYADGGVRVTAGPLLGSRGEFLRDPTGEWRWLRMFGRIHARSDAPVVS